MADARLFVVPGVLEKVPDVCKFVVEAAEAAGLDDRAVYHCQMAVDEWCTNVIEHGYKAREADGRIEVVCRTQGGRFVIEVGDDGPPFDPTTLPEADPDQPLENREPGGLGWFFIRKIMDEVQYRYQSGRNLLTMVKNGAEEAPKPAKKGQEAQFVAEPLRDDIWVMRLSGRLDSTVGRDLEAALAGEIEAAHALLVIDMTRVAYISSSGLKALIAARRMAQKQNGAVVLAALSPRVREVFEISGFDTLFIIVPSVEEAGAYIDSLKTAQ